MSDLTPVSALMMISEKLERKLAERRVRSFGETLSGIVDAAVFMASNGQFALHRSAIEQFCKIDSVPHHHWKHPVDEKLVLDFVCSELSQHENTIYIPREKPFIVAVEVRDWKDFIESIWRTRGTMDLTLFLTSPSMVLELQDLEYELACFKLLLPG